MGKFLRNWGGLTVATVALLASASAVYFDNAHFEETSIREEERDRKRSEEFKQSLKHQKELDEGQNRRHKELVELQQKRYDEQIRQHEESMELAHSALDIESKHYQELDKQFKDVIEPKTRHDEILHYIKFLEDRLERYWNWISPLSGYQSEVGEAHYMKAARNCESAKGELMARNFELAEQLVKAANANLDEGYLAVTSSNTTASVD